MLVPRGSNCTEVTTSCYSQFIKKRTIGAQSQLTIEKFWAKHRKISVCFQCSTILTTIQEVFYRSFFEITVKLLIEKISKADMASAFEANQIPAKGFFMFRRRGSLRQVHPVSSVGAELLQSHNHG